MSESWNAPGIEQKVVERLLNVASAQAETSAEGLEAFALLIDGLDAPALWRTRVRTHALYQMKAMADANAAPASDLASIGRALALVREPE